MVLELTYSNLEFLKFSSEDPRFSAFWKGKNGGSAGMGERQGVGIRWSKWEGERTKDGWGRETFPQTKIYHYTTASMFTHSCVSCSVCGYLLNGNWHPCLLLWTISQREWCVEFGITSGMTGVVMWSLSSKKKKCDNVTRIFRCTKTRHTEVHR